MAPTTGLDTYEVAFLLGAGASVPAGVPDTIHFVTEFVESTPPHAEQLATLIDSLRTWCDARGRLLDVEVLYEVLRSLGGFEESYFVDQVPVESCALSRNDAATVCHALEDFIHARAFVAPDKAEYLHELRLFVARSRPLRIFSTNYDTAVELACSQQKLTWEDGFSLYWSPDVFEDRDADVHLVKLHGSVLWYRDDCGNYIRSPMGRRAADDQPPLLFSGACEPLLIYPARKSANDAPYSHNMQMLSRCLGTRESRVLLIVVGYSFRDDHLRTLLFDAARRNASLRVVLVDPRAAGIYEDQLRHEPRDGENPSPLDGRVVPLSRPLDAELLRDLRRDVVRSLETALQQEELGIGREATDRVPWAPVAALYLKAGDFESAWRCLGREGFPQLLGPNQLPQFLAGLLRELRQLVDAGWPPHPFRKLHRDVEQVASRYQSETAVSQRGNTDRYQASGPGGAALMIVNTVRTEAETCLRRADALERCAGHEVRVEAYRDLADWLRQLAPALEVIEASSDRGLDWRDLTDLLPDLPPTPSGNPTRNAELAQESLRRHLDALIGVGVAWIERWRNNAPWLPPPGP